MIQCRLPFEIVREISFDYFVLAIRIASRVGLISVWGLLVSVRVISLFARAAELCCSHGRTNCCACSVPKCTSLSCDPPECGNFDNMRKRSGCLVALYPAFTATPWLFGLPFGQPCHRCPECLCNGEQAKANCLACIITGYETLRDTNP